LFPAEIDWATWMLTELFGVGTTDAFIRWRAYACTRDLRLTDVARDVVARRLPRAATDRAAFGEQRG
jgi:hypothetical protein